MTQVFAVIMAGGKGTRFWPLSRRAWPKQFLSLDADGASLLQTTVRRIRPLFPPENIFVVTSDKHAGATAGQLPELPRENILAEPAGRNTAPCVGWAASHVRRRDPAGVMAVLPADPRIEDEPAYREVIGHALSAAAAGSIVTCGIKPTRAETGYGYIEIGDPAGPGVYRVRRFVEKPDREKAEAFVAGGAHLWNSGMFFFRADTILAAVERYLPELHAALKRFDAASEQGRETEAVKETYPGIPSESIDYGIMEKVDDILVVPGAFGWYDIGSWTTAWELAQKDEKGNALLSEAVAIDTRNCYMRGQEGKVVALLGVDDLVVVDTPDALLVAKRDQAQEVKAIVTEIEKKNRGNYL